MRCLFLSPIRKMNGDLKMREKVRFVQEKKNWREKEEREKEERKCGAKKELVRLIHLYLWVNISREVFCKFRLIPGKNTERFLIFKLYLQNCIYIENVQ